MKAVEILKAGLGVAFLALLAGCASGDNGQSDSTAPEGKSDANGVEEVAAIPVEDPCRCFEEGLSRGELRYCREAKREVNFLEALRKCGDAEVQGVSAIGKLPGDGQYTMNPDQCVVQWKGSKVGMTEKGTVPIRSCTMLVQNNAVVSANVVIEMNAIKATDQEGVSARSLEQHLRSADFFDVPNHPTASFIMESGSSDGRGNLILKGKLNIKGTSKPASAIVNFGSSDPVVANVTMAFDRSEFDVRYGSGSFFDGLGDDLISDEVQLQMVLVEDVTQRKVL
jgi:polyisoprenoid-binding protein YceI